MSRQAWRIGVEAPPYGADDLSGAGAKATGGRWNEAGVPVVYTSRNVALACLETLVHLKAGGLPLHRHLVRIAIPDDLWAAARIETSATLPAGWDAEPPGRASIAFGTDWLKARETAVLIVPSVIVPEEANVLINPAHPDSGRISAAKARRWLYDPRLTRIAWRA